MHVTVTQKHLQNAKRSTKFLNWTVDTTGSSNLVKFSVSGDPSYTVKVVRRDGKELANMSVDQEPVSLEMTTEDCISAKAVIRKRGFFSWMMLSSSADMEFPLERLNSGHHLTLKVMGESKIET